jgi:hypothetical protein
MANETKKTEAPPYIAFSTFLSFIKGLAVAGVPSRIDKSLLRNMSGGNQSALLAALKWFDLIDDVGVPTKALEALVDDEAGIGALLREMMPVAYEFMADGSINLERATGSMVEEKFRAYGLSGSTIVKAMAFFISACKEASITLGTHIKLPKVVRANGGGKIKKARQEPAGEVGADVPPPPLVKPQTSTASALMDKFPAFDPSWAPNIQEQWFTAFGKMQDMIKDK